MLLAATAIVLSVSVWTFISGTLIPLVTGIITKQVASSALKAVCTAVLATVAGLVTSAMTHDGTLYLEESLMAVMVTFVTAISTYYGFLKPTGISGTVQSKTASLGIG